MKSNQIKLGVVLSYTQMFLQIVVGLLYTPIMLRLLGKEEYGLYNTVSSTIATLSLLSFGFGSAYIRYFSRYKRNDDNNALSRLNGLFLYIFSIIGIVAALCGTWLSFNLELVFDTGLSSGELEKAKILMLLLTFSMAFGFPMSVFTSIITAHEKFIVQKLIIILSVILNPFLSIPCLLLGYGSIGVVSVSVVLNILSWTISVIYCIHSLHVKFCFKQIETALFKELLAYSFFIALNMIVDQINTNLAKFLLGRFCGTVSVAIYSVGFSLYNYYQNFSISISNVFTPRIHRICETNSKKEGIDYKKIGDEFTELFVKVSRIQFIILVLVCSGLIFFGKTFIVFWAGVGYENAYYVTLLLAVPAIVPLTQNLGIEMQRAVNKHKFRAIIYTIMAFLNVLISIPLCKNFGEIGSAIGTAISYIICNGFIMNIYYYKAININIILYWKNIIWMLVKMIPAFICGTIIYKFFELNSLIKLAVGIFIYAFVYIMVVFFIVTNEEEKSIIRNSFSRIKINLDKR